LSLWHPIEQQECTARLPLRKNAPPQLTVPESAMATLQLTKVVLEMDEGIVEDEKIAPPFWGSESRGRQFAKMDSDFFQIFIEQSTFCTAQICQNVAEVAEGLLQLRPSSGRLTPELTAMPFPEFIVLQ
jgi:hypothetical protein